MVFPKALFQQPSAPPGASSPGEAADAGDRRRWVSRLLKSLRTLGRRQSTSVVGLDFGSSAIKLVRVDSTGGGPRVVDVACEEYPLRLEGNAQEAFMQERLKGFKRQGLLDGRLVIGVPNHDLAVELATLPKMPAGDLNRAVIWEAKERITTDLSAHSVRHLVIGETSSNGQSQYEIMIVATQREGLVAQWRAFTSQGLRILAMEPAILALLGACETAGVWRRDEFVGLLELGRRHSTLAFLVNGMVRFVRSFPIAGDSITQSIVDYCQTDYETAETQKREIGLSQMALEEDRRVTGLEVEPRVRVSHALGLYLERLAAEIDHSLRYLTLELGQAKDRKLDSFYLLGGGALLKNLSAFLASRLNARVDVADPFRGCAIAPKAQQQLQTSPQGARLACALGLALHPPAK